MFIIFRLMADVHDIRHESAEGDGDYAHTKSVSAQLRFRSRSYFPSFEALKPPVWSHVS